MGAVPPCVPVSQAQGVDAIDGALCRMLAVLHKRACITGPMCRCCRCMCLPSCAHTGLFAIEIMAMCPGGAWRTLSEWRALFREAGMELSSKTDVGCNMSLMVWKPRPMLG